MVYLKEAKPIVSVLICARNAEKYIRSCIQSLLKQKFTDFEVIIVDDLSSDKTSKIIREFKDNRIKYFRNQKWLGISKSRNVCLKHAKGVYLFFTDSDCIVSEDWLAQGLKYLHTSEIAGVEGKTYYVSKNYKPTLSDHSFVNSPGDFLTGNVAYKRCIVSKIGGFDERYTYLEDRDFALRILKFGEIKFNPNMLVFVHQQTLTPKDIINRSNANRNRVYLFKKFNDKRYMTWRVVDPRGLAAILFPPLIFTMLFSSNVKKSDDFKLIPFKYVSAIYGRVKLWKECAKERVFLI